MKSPKEFVEIEIKFPLHNPQDVREYLGNNCKLIEENIYQKDIYFTPAHKNFMEPEIPYEYFRFRQSNNKYALTYKHLHPEGTYDIEYYDEYETGIENPEAMMRIINVLGFKEIVTVEKTRFTYTYKDTEICLDNVTNLGWFIEVESKKPGDNIQEIRESLMQILKEIGAEVGDTKATGYLDMLLKQMEQK
ncbi:MAG: class IV adenylate cyclase [Ignavibacteriae bacterium]|nr:class IV adenylate cyclase [Ignavibacteriota bacterium]